MKSEPCRIFCGDLYNVSFINNQASLSALQTSKNTGWLFGFGVPLLLAALFFQTVTLASQQYARVLITALLLTVLADLCIIQAFRRGGRITKIVSVILLLPTLFVVADFFRRAPHSF